MATMDRTPVCFRFSADDLILCFSSFTSLRSWTRTTSVLFALLSLPLASKCRCLCLHLRLQQPFIWLLHRGCACLLNGRLAELTQIAEMQSIMFLEYAGANIIVTVDLGIDLGKHECVNSIVGGGVRQAFIQVHACVHTQMYMQAYIQVCMQVYMHKCTCRCTCNCTCRNISLHT